jgi:hypothetical protein
MSAMDDASDQETQRDSERAGRFDQRVNTRRRMGRGMTEHADA